METPAKSATPTTSGFWSSQPAEFPRKTNPFWKVHSCEIRQKYAEPLVTSHWRLSLTSMGDNARGFTRRIFSKVAWYEMIFCAVFWHKQGSLSASAVPNSHRRRIILDACSKRGCRRGKVRNRPTGVGLALKRRTELESPCSKGELNSIEIPQFRSRPQRHRLASSRIPYEERNISFKTNFEPFKSVQIGCNRGERERDDLEKCKKKCICEYLELQHFGTDLPTAPRIGHNA